MAEYALILGLIAIFVMVAVFFLGGKINDLFDTRAAPSRTRRTGSARTHPGSTRRWPPALFRAGRHRLALGPTVDRSARPLPFGNEARNLSAPRSSED